MSKKLARKQVREILSGLNSKELSALSLSLSHNLEAYLENIISQDFPKKSVIGGFSPIQKEARWFQSELIKSSRLAVPDMEEGSEMSFYEVDFQRLERGLLGIRLDEEDRGLLVEPDILLIPGLAFDKKLRRLGRGAGYYDRYLSSFRGLKIGICFECQILEKVPVDEHDIDCDLLITEKNIYTKGK